MKSRVLFCVAALVSLAALGYLFATTAPLGIPGEWEWGRIELSRTALNEVLLNLGIVAPAGAMWLAYVLWGARRIDRENARSGLLLTGLFGVSMLWIFAVQVLPPSPHSQLKGWVLYLPETSGYFYEARYEMNDADEFLAGYEAKMAAGDVLHVGTHPPGLFLLNRGVWTLCRDWPQATAALRWSTPSGLNESFDTLSEIAAERRLDLTDADKAALWLDMLLTQAAAVFACVPLFLMLRRSVSKSAAWLAASTWVLVPALAAFLPKSDALMAGLGAVFLWLWISGLQERSVVRSVAAGVVFWLGSLCSLAIVPVGLAAGLFGLAEWFSADNRKRAFFALLKTGVISAGTFFVLCGLFWWIVDVNLFRVWMWNYANHARFYEEYPRTPLRWVWENPIETVFAVGAPLTVLGGVGVRQSFRRTDPLRSLVVGCLLAWGLIWLSGKNSGESARLWLVFFPWVCLLAGPAFDREPDSQRQDSTWVASPWMWLTLQMLVSASTVLRVKVFLLGQ